MTSIRFRLFLWISAAFLLAWVIFCVGIGLALLDMRHNDYISRMQDSLERLRAETEAEAANHSNSSPDLAVQSWIWATEATALPELVSKRIIIQNPKTKAWLEYQPLQQRGKFQLKPLEEQLLRAFLSNWQAAGSGIRLARVRHAAPPGLGKQDVPLWNDRILVARQDRVLNNQPATVYYLYSYQQKSFQLSMGQEILQKIGWLLLIGLLALLFISYTVANYLSIPLRQLADMACKIGQGDLDVDLPISRRQDEIGLLGIAMKIMAESLKNSYEQLAKHSSSLEETVHSQTEQLEKEKSYLNSVLHSIHDGLLVVDENLLIQPGVSKNTYHILEQEEVVGKHLVELLYLYDDEHEEDARLLKDTLMTAFHLWIPEQFPSITANLPAYWKINFKQQAKYLKIVLSPIVEKGQIQKVIVTLADETEQQAVRRASHFIHFKAVGFIEQLQLLTENKTQKIALSDFLHEGNRSISEVQQMLLQANDFDANLVFRNLHTVKGNARALGLDSLAFLAHEAEGLVQKYRDKRESYRELDHDELRSHINYLLRGINAAQFILRANLDEQEGFPLRWQAYTEATAQGVYQIARELEKQVEIEWSINSEMGIEDFSALKRVVIHMLRNAVDHGIEPTEQRMKAHKSPIGRINVQIEGTEAYWQIMIQDDGAGIDIEKLRSRALMRNIPVPNKRLATKDLLDILCHPGFTLKDEITDVSGRGVGMDAVAHEVRLLGGDLELVQSSSQGTVFRLYWPRQDKPANNKEEGRQVMTA